MKQIIVFSSLFCLVSLLMPAFCQTTTIPKSSDLINTRSSVTTSTSINKSILNEQATQPVMSVTTDEIRNIASTTAGCTFTVGKGTVATEIGVCLSKAPGPTVNNQKYSPSKGSLGPTFYSDLTGLTPNMKFYVRAYAKNSSGVVVYGNELSFTTLPPQK